MADPDDPVSTASSATAAALGAVRRQLRALGAERVDLLLVDARTGERESRTGLSPNDVERSLDRLLRRNEQGAEVLVRPADGAPSVLVADVSRERLDRLDRPDHRGLEPAAVVEIGDGADRRYEVWLRHREGLSRAEADVAAALLAGEVRGRVSTATEPALERYGHLAGFATPLAAGRGAELEGGHAPVAELRRAGGGVYEREAEVREEVRALLLERSAGDRLPPLGRAAQHELEAAIEREARDPRHGLGFRGEPAAEVEIARELDAWRAARDRYLALATAPLPAEAAPAEERLRREIDQVEAYRSLREVEARLEEATGLRPLPAQLDAADLSRAAEIGGRLAATHREVEAAEDRLAVSDRPEVAAILAEREASLRQRSEEALAFERDHGVRLDPAPAETLAEAALAARPPSTWELDERSARLRDLADALGRDPGPVELGALREAWSAKLDGEIALEAWRADLARAARALTIEHDDVALRLERLERGAEREPSRAAFERLDQVRDQLDGLERQLDAVRGELTAAELRTNDRALERIGLGLDVAAGETTVWDRAGEPFRAYAERLERGHELREELSGRDPLLAGEIRPAEGPELREARVALAEATTRLLEERTPAALAAHRSAADRVADLETGARDRSAAAELAEARHLLKRALRDLEPGRREGRASGEAVPAAGEVARLRRALDRHQAAEERLASRIPEVRSARPASDGPSDPARFAALLDRVRRGDRTPETLERLHRSAERELLAQRTPGARGVPERAGQPVESKRDLLATIDRFRRSRAALDREIHGRPAPLDRRDPDALERLLPLLARHREAAASLDQATERYLDGARGPGARLLPVRYFLRHPEYRAAPHRAVAAWARHAAERGRSAPEIRARLARQPKVNLVRPSLRGRRFAGRVAFWGVRWAGRMLHQLVHDEVRSR